MRQLFISFLILFGATSFIQAQELEAKNQIQYNDPQVPTSIGIVLYSNDVETIFNAFRFANYSQEWDNQVSIYLLGKGVELEGLVKTNNEIKEQVDKFLAQNGIIMGCQTCFQNRQQTESKICKVSCIQDLYDLVKKNKIVLTF